MHPYLAANVTSNVTDANATDATVNATETTLESEPKADSAQDSDEAEPDSGEKEASEETGGESSSDGEAGEEAPTKEDVKAGEEAPTKDDVKANATADAKPNATADEAKAKTTVKRIMVARKKMARVREWGGRQGAWVRMQRGSGCHCLMGHAMARVRGWACSRALIVIVWWGKR